MSYSASLVRAERQPAFRVTVLSMMPCCVSVYAPSSVVPAFCAPFGRPLCSQLVNFAELQKLTKVAGLLARPLVAVHRYEPDWPDRVIPPAA